MLPPDELARRTRVASKRIGPSYRAILDELTALHGQRLPPLDPQASGGGPSERLLPWRVLRDSVAASFGEAARSLGGRVHHAPQSIWLDAAAEVTRSGRCAGLALAWAFDPAPALFDNVFAAAAHPDDAGIGPVF